jgi:hypothetical protein
VDAVESPDDDDAVDVESFRLLDDVATRLGAGQCILFLGSGVHWPPPDKSPFSYPEEHRPASATTLRDQLAELSRWDQRYKNKPRWDLQRMSLDFEIEAGRERLVTEIRSAVDEGKRPSPVVKALAALNFPLVVTTNYDRLFEQALRGHGKDPQVAYYSATPAPLEEAVQPTEHRPFVFKMHGDVDHPESIVITDEDYIQFVLRMSDRDPTMGAIPTTLSYHFKVWPTLFVGYSLMDYNLRLLFKTLRWRIDEARTPETYSVDLAPDPLVLSVWQNHRRLVKFIVEDVWSFVPKLYDRVTGSKMPE